jgi:hypothetical protein
LGLEALAEFLKLLFVLYNFALDCRKDFGIVLLVLWNILLSGFEMKIGLLLSGSAGNLRARLQLGWNIFR